MSNGPRLVLLPGLDGSGLLFERFLAAAPPQIDVDVVSYPGDLRLGYADLVPRVRERLPTDRPYVIIGESFSGPVALALAADPVGDLRGVVLVATFATPPAPRWLAHLPWRILFVLPTSTLAMRRLLAGNDDALIGELRRVVRLVSPRVLAARVASTLSVDARDALARIRHPLLYIQATRDRVVPRRCLRDILAVRDDVSVRRIDSLHTVLQLAPDAAWRVVSEFVRSACAS